MIDWAAFNWEAFATLATGLAAVGGATYIGARQVAISDRQSRIMEQQVATEQLRLRAELFDRRLEVYDATTRLLGGVIAHADRPVKEDEKRFVAALAQARFLFRAEVYEGLRTIWKEVNNYSAIKATMNGTFQREGHYGDGMPEKEHALLSKLLDRLTQLSGLFGDELRLGQGPAPPMPSISEQSADQPAPSEGESDRAD